MDPLYCHGNCPAAGHRHGNIAVFAISGAVSMKHYILGKWKPEVSEKALLCDRIRKLFADADQIPGVHGASVYENCVDRENRYGIMIVMDMEREAISAWDASELHHRWKAMFGDLLEKKAIFDHE